MDKLKLLVVLVVVLALSGCMEDVIRVPDFENKTYINASNISMVGAGGTSGSLENISDLNMGYFNVTEGNAQPFYVTVNFTNITNFSFLEAKARYFSISGTPSSHVVDLEIYCTTDNEYEDLFFLENAAEWRYFTRHFPDSMHFIDTQGNVSVKFNHSANGNVNHVLWIDTVRLITSAQYEQNIVTLNQYFNTTTTGTGGVSNLSNLTIDSNKSWLGYNIYNVTIDNQSMSNKVNKSGDNMTGTLNMGENSITNTSNTWERIYNGHDLSFSALNTPFYINFTKQYSNYQININMNKTSAGDITNFIYIYVNNRAVDSDYWGQYQLASGAGVTAARNNLPLMFALDSDYSGLYNGYLLKDKNGLFRVRGYGSRYNATNIEMLDTTIVSNFTITSIDNLSFVTPQNPGSYLDIDIMAIK